MKNRLSAALVVAGVFVCADATSVWAHAVCGARVFPATLGIDDPGVGDELALPTITFLPQNSDGVQETDATFNYTKTIFPNFGISFGDGATWLKPGGFGWQDLNTEAKYNFLCLPDSEFMASVGLTAIWGTGGGVDVTPFNVYQPVLDIGKGFGDLPQSVNVLRPFAVTAELSDSIPDRAFSDGAQNPSSLNWGFTVQYSLPYYNSNVAGIDNEFFRRLVPITEFTFSRPVSNFAPGQNQTTGTIQPGVIYMAEKWQFALEAVLPLNKASGHGVGVVGELHFYFDDIFPNSIGKPIFETNPLPFIGGHA